MEHLYCRGSYPPLGLCAGAPILPRVLPAAAVKSKKIKRHSPYSVDGKVLKGVPLFFYYGGLSC